MVMRLSTRRLMASVIYAGSAVCSVTGLVIAAPAMDTTSLILCVCGASLWSAAAVHTLWRDYRAVTESDEQNIYSERLRPSTHSMINAGLYIVSASSYLAADFRWVASQNKVIDFNVLSSLFWLKGACINFLVAATAERTQEERPWEESGRFCSALWDFIAEVDCLMSGIMDELAMTSEKTAAVADIAGNVCWMVACLHDTVQAGLTLRNPLQLRNSIGRFRNYLTFSEGSWSSDQRSPHIENVVTPDSESSDEVDLFEVMGYQRYTH